MTASPRTAKIYAFPAGGRAPPGRQRETARMKAQLPPRTAAERAPKMVFGSNWYHQAAIDEAEDAWER